MKRRTLLSNGAALLALPALSQAAAPLKELRLDYAYYSPSSLVLKRFGWLEEDLGKNGTQVKWVFSAGSNRALEYLNASSLDIASSAGLAALLSRANGNPIKAPYIFSRPEWTALAVRADSPIQSLKDLKGKKVAATKGTDPFLFLLRALPTVGLKRSDVEIVALQHADGKAALEQGRVDAWAGLDPLLAASELGPVNTDFTGCVGGPKGLAPGANRSWVGDPARIGNAAMGLLGPNPKGSVLPERHSALRALPRRPVWAATHALIGAQGAGFAPVKPVSAGPCRWSRALT